MFTFATCACGSNFSHNYQRYNPELQKKALAGRQQRQEDFDAFVMQLKEASKSDKPSKQLSDISTKRSLYQRRIC
jgi:DNA-directed RNA polymerase subunit N (RpoN/RPB10)